jgi:preprotein translocase subunit SecF
MKKYQSLDIEVVSKIKYEFDDKLTPEQKQKYRSIIENQYEELKYEIVEVKESGVTGEVVIRFTVYDLASAMEQANSYIAVYGDKFKKDGKFDEYAAIDYKLEMLDEVETKVDYTITFNFYKEDGTWTMDEVVESDLKKIRGTF